MTTPNLQKLKGTATAGYDLSDATVTHVMKLSTTSGATAATLTNDTIGTTAEDGFLSFDVGGTTVKVPYWIDD